jgi:hypothetical protein
MPSDRASLQALKNLLTETDLLIAATDPLPENRTHNFCRLHKTLRVTPAMEAGITSRVWTLAELLR